jgi:hypothetical protein
MYTMQSAYLWQLWPGRHWPFSPEEEQALLVELESLNSKSSTFDRGDVTAVMNMIRLGLDFAQVHQYAPGLLPGRLLAAYNYLERRRNESEDAFEALLANPTYDMLQAEEPLASRLVPIPTFWMSRAIKEGSTEDARAVAAYVHQEVSALASAVAVAERHLARKPPAKGANLDEYVRRGRILYNPYEECLWARPFFLPTRVGALMPPRVDDLLPKLVK